jgi:hypothetical protein
MTSLPERPREDVILELAVAEFARRGIEAPVERAPEGYRITLPTGKVMLLVNLVHYSQDLDPSEWEELVRDFVHGALESETATAPEKLSAGQLRHQIRTRLVRDIEDSQVDTSYAREFTPGMIQVLCVDYPETVVTLDAQQLTKLALPAQDLYAIGQANTDAEPVGEPYLAADNVYALEGESFFIASKAANFSALVPGVIGPAPLGVVFAIPHCALLLYSVITQEDFAQQVGAIVKAATVIAFDPDAHYAGGVLSPFTYYWAPDGTVNAMGGCFPDEDGTPRLRVVPPDSFLHYLHIDPENPHLNDASRKRHWFPRRRAKA